MATPKPTDDKAPPAGTDKPAAPDAAAPPKDDKAPASPTDADREAAAADDKPKETWSQMADRLDKDLGGWAVIFTWVLRLLGSFLDPEQPAAATADAGAAAAPTDADKPVPDPEKARAAAADATKDSSVGPATDVAGSGAPGATPTPPKDPAAAVTK